MKPDMPPVLLINLKRSEQRLQRSVEQLERLNVEYLRVEAEDGEQISQAQADAVLASPYSGYYKKLSKAELGCYLSHKKCWQHIVDNKLAYALILEDDFVLEKGFDLLLTSAIDELKLEWDCIKLTEQPEKRKAVHQLKFLHWDLITYNKIPSRTGAYLISQSGAQKMLAHAKQISRPVDIDFQYWWDKQLNVFGMKPYPVSICMAANSTIDSTKGQRKKAEKSVVKQVTQKLSYTIINKIKTKKRVRELEVQHPRNRT